jgi:Fe-S-cluster containining protein
VKHPFRDDPARAELRKLYEEVDALVAGLSCDSTAECCEFAIFGREPYPTAVELAELEVAIRASPPKSAKTDGRGKARSLPQVTDVRRCPLLGPDRRCGAYASRPFGCRTFFCHRVQGGSVPRAAVQEIGRKIADLSARFSPRDPGPRPLSKAIQPILRGRG